MKIGVDVRCLEEEKISGVGEYALELLKSIFEIKGKNEYILFSNSFKKKIDSFSWVKEYPNVKLKKFRYPNKVLNFFFWYFNWPKIDKLIGEVDLFFAPNINFISISRNCPLIATFHDLSFERYPYFFSAKTRLWHFYFVNPRKIAANSRKLISVSESTQKDLGELYGIDDNVEIIYHGVSPDYQVIDRNDPELLEIQKKYNLPYRFILYLGNIEPRKNIGSLIDAYCELRHGNLKFEKYKLVLAGDISPLCREIVEKANKSAYRKDIYFAGYVDEKDKPYIFNLASLFVYPSHFEGFGLPALEAMACGTPVITSNRSSLPEVAEKAAITVDSNRPDEISTAMKTVLEDKKIRDLYRERGLRQAKKFSWEKCARKTLDLFEKILDEDRKSA
jgi:glycosyltransferase involved in cell wall biosynthesis